MQVNSVNGAQTGAAAATQSTSSGTGLNYDAFLQLLIAELKNQDPTKPMDSAQYIAQLAGFSNVEQSVKLNAKIDTLIATQSISQANSLIGRTVTSADGTVTGKVVSVQILDDGMVADLQDGKKINLTTGIKVHA